MVSHYSSSCLYQLPRQRVILLAQCKEFGESLQQGDSTIAIPYIEHIVILLWFSLTWWDSSLTTLPGNCLINLLVV